MGLRSIPTLALPYKAALVVLPGLDGLALLSAAFAESMGATFESVVSISYPPDRVLGYDELESFVRNALPKELPYVLLGQSFSGPVAMAMAASRPPGLVGLVLSTTFSKSPMPWLSPLASLTRFAPVRPMPHALLSWVLLGRWATQELDEALRASLQAVSSSVLRFRGAAALRANVSSRLEAISIPVLYLRASDDRLFSRSVSAHVLAGIPHAEVVDIPGPHLLLQAAPAECASAIARFVSGLASGAE